MKRSQLKQLIKEIVSTAMNETPIHVSKIDPDVSNKFKSQVAKIVDASKTYKLDSRILLDLAAEVYETTFACTRMTSTTDLKKQLGNNPAIRSVIFKIVRKSQDDIGGVSVDDVNELVSAANLAAQTNQKRFSSRRYSGARGQQSETPWEQ